MKSLAVKYRPDRFCEIVEQDEIKLILQNQLDNNDIRNAYLFVGSAGTGKTTSARAFAQKINEYKGKPIEIDAASYSGVDDIREIIQMAKSKSIDSKYKIFIVDECHSLSNQAWQALLKTLEETPESTIFIFCTTNPEKIPATILSRVQRFNFKRISKAGIVAQLTRICNAENINAEVEAIEYIAKLADGGMRDAITMLDKCSSYTDCITVNSVTESLGLPYIVEDIAMLLLNLSECRDSQLIEQIELAHNNGVDLRQLIDEEILFVLDYSKWRITGSMKYCRCPNFMEEWFKKEYYISTDILNHILNSLLEIKRMIKYDANPKCIVESMLLLESNFIRSL